MPVIDSHLKIVFLRNFSLFLPLFACVLILTTRKLKQKQLVSTFLSFLWCFFSLSILNLLAIRFHFWSFYFEGGSFMGVPLDLLLGWAILWSVIPSLLSEKISAWVWLFGFFLFDVVFMPFLSPLVQLGDFWLLFDMVCLLVAFVPSRLLFYFTLFKKNLYLRVILQFIVFAMMFLFFLPLLIVENTSSVSSHIEKIFGKTKSPVVVSQVTSDNPSEILENQSDFKNITNKSSPLVWGLYLLIFSAISVLGLSAVQEFAIRGRGTAIPMDSPRKLVTTGPYAYMRNPMQVSLFLIYLLLAFILKNYWFAVFSLMICFYAVFTSWSEGGDLSLRFGADWKKYKKSVRNFFPLWKPLRDTPSEIFMDFNNCPISSKLYRLLKTLKFKKLIIKPMETYPLTTHYRMIYRDTDGFKERGVCALGRALEQVNFLWAVVGFSLRLPIVSHILQGLVNLCFSVIDRH